MTLRLKLTPDAPERCIPLCGHALDHRQRLRVARGGDDGPARLDDPRLLLRDLRDGAPQAFYVVEADVGDHRDPRIQHVGRIVGAA